MLTQPHVFSEKLRPERSGRLAAACDIASRSIGIVFYDLELRRRYARSVLVGETVTPLTAERQLGRLLLTAQRELSIPASAIETVGAAASVAASAALEGLSAAELYLNPQTEIHIIPYISAGIGGRFTASLLTLPRSGFVAADVGGDICLAACSEDGGIVCAAFPLTGAFDGAALEGGMTGERGAIDAVRRESDGTLCYGVAGDCDGIGISPCGAVCAAEIMLTQGIIDADGILTDRDIFTIGEDIFISQADVRFIQADKARCRAALELFCERAGARGGLYVSGEPFACADGPRAMLRLGALPDSFGGAGFCRSSAEQGIISFLESERSRTLAQEIVSKAQDITQSLIADFDELYINNLLF